MKHGTLVMVVALPLAVCLCLGAFVLLAHAAVWQSAACRTGYLHGTWNPANNGLAGPAVVYDNANPKWGKTNPLTTEDRGYFSFDFTGQIPQNAHISKVEFYYNNLVCFSDPLGLASSILDICQATGSCGPMDHGYWDGGTCFVEQNWGEGGPTDGWIDLGQSGAAAVQVIVNRENVPYLLGLLLRDQSLSSKPQSWDCIANAGRCSLRITYSLPGGGLGQKLDGHDEQPASWGKVKSIYN